MTRYPVRDCQCKYARHKHGTNSAYQSDRCRCFNCRVAHANSRAVNRRGESAAERVAGVGTMRRLQALAVLGWSAPAIGEEVGVSGRQVVSIRSGARAGSDATIEAIHAFYARVWDRRRVAPGAAVVRWNAEASGWVPPLAWDDIDNPAEYPNTAPVQTDLVDEVAVVRACAGMMRWERLGMAERVEAVRRLAAAGLNDGLIGERLGYANESGPLMVRRRNGIPPAVPRNGWTAAA